jgi:hypothetical protein
MSHGETGCIMVGSLAGEPLVIRAGLGKTIRDISDSRSYEGDTSYSVLFFLMKYVSIL